ncbi:MAG: hypothetical protein ACRDT7_15590 [Microbacterium sp.]
MVANRLEVVDLGLGHGGDVPDLAEAVRIRLVLEELDRAADHLRDRGRAVVVANDPSGDPRRAGTDHDVACAAARAQLHG